MADERKKQANIKLSYAAIAKKPGDSVDSLRLACSITYSLASTLNSATVKDVKIEFLFSNICENVASAINQHFKTNLREETIFNAAKGQQTFN